MKYVTGYLICGEFEYRKYRKIGVLPENHYKRRFLTAREIAEQYVNERPVRNLKILEFSVPEIWVTSYESDPGSFECVHALSLRKYLHRVF